MKPTRIIRFLFIALLLTGAVEANAQEAIPYQLVEVRPKFGGREANEFAKWVNDRIVYPELAKEKGLSGRVIVRFTISSEGEVGDVRVIRGVDPSLDKEAVRVVSSSPRWSPGKQRGESVDVSYTFPVIFQLRNDPLPITKETPLSYQLVEEKPKFNGGEANEFSRWVNQRLVYPEAAKEKGISGRVVVRFTITSEGKVTNVGVIRGVDPSLDKEAVRVVSSSPRWTPGRQDGERVDVVYTFPVIFLPRDDQDEELSLPSGAIPYAIVEEKPKFRGGDENAFTKWIHERIIYPEIAKEDGVYGRVLVRFTVTSEGRVSDVSVVRGVDPSLDSEAVRVVSSSPRWTPGRQGGERVDVVYTVPVIFQSSDAVGLDEPSLLPSGAIPYTMVEVKPKFRGGDENAFSRWIQERLVYPEIAKEDGVYGRVLVQFTITSDGGVTGVKVVRGVDRSLDSEAVRVVSSSPRWTPGRQNGEKVDVVYTCPVIFQLPD